MALHCGLDPFKAMQSSLVSVATGLSTVDGKSLSIFSLSSKRALENAVQLLSDNSTWLNKAIVVAGGFGTFAAGVYYYVYRNKDLHDFIGIVGSRFKGSITISADDPLNKDILTHLVHHGLGKDARSLSLVSPNKKLLRRSNRIMDHYYDQMGIPPGMEPGNIKSPADEVEIRALEFVPQGGYSYTFWHDGYRISVERELAITEQPQQQERKHAPVQKPSNDPAAPHHIILTCWSLGAGVTPIISFLDSVTRLAQLAVRDDRTTVHRIDMHQSRAANQPGQPQSSYLIWDAGVSRPARTLDSVAMATDIKTSLIRDVARYLSPAEERYYAQRGIPYRRGLLFYGPPGTGKTSFSIALAGHFKLRLYIISLSDGLLTDQGLETLFEMLPHRCIVLIEDIDTASISRTAESKPQMSVEAAEERYQAAKKEAKRLRLPKPDRKTITQSAGVTLGGLLNCLDGPCSKDGRLVCLTSNSPDNLDAALLRPGRIDSKILFGYASHEVSVILFKHIFTKTADEVAGDDVERLEDSNDVPDISAIAEDFAAQIHERITPAEVQGYLIKHRDDPRAALANVSDWAHGVAAVKNRGANVAAFDNEIQDGMIAEPATDSGLTTISSSSSDGSIGTKSNKNDAFPGPGVFDHSMLSGLAAPMPGSGSRVRGVRGAPVSFRASRRRIY